MISDHPFLSQIAVNQAWNAICLIETQIYVMLYLMRNKFAYLSDKVISAYEHLATLSKRTL